jgi:hypothetical protein
MCIIAFGLLRFSRNLKPASWLTSYDGKWLDDALQRHQVLLFEWALVWKI